MKIYNLLLCLLFVAFSIQVTAQKKKSRLQPGKIYEPGETLYAPRAIMLSSTVFTIIDMDRPRSGLINMYKPNEKIIEFREMFK